MITRISGAPGVYPAEKKYRKYPQNELLPYAKNTPFLEIAETVIPDKEGPWANP